jgi:lon-related putative ATP-dependent protease
MSTYQSLPSEKLRRNCNPEIFQFTDTSQIPSSREVIGQQRAIEAMEFGLHIKMDGYNIYMAGESGEGKTRHALDMARKHAKNRKTPDDWCYVYNFEDLNAPRAIHLPAGKGKVFKEEMDSFIKILQQEISKAFEGEDYEEEREKILQNFKEKKEELVSIMSQGALEHGFKVRITSSGLYFIPIINGEPISEEAFKELGEEEKAEISERSEALQKEAYGIIRKIKELEMEAEDAVKEWENQIALFAVGIHIDDLKERYRDYPDIIRYLQGVQDDILDNLDSFRDEEPSEETAQSVVPLMLKRSGADPTERYKVNLLVDNSRLSGAPVIVDYNPTYYNLLGRVDYENEFGTITSDYSMIKPGLFHQANGGYLILQVIDVMNNPQSWEVIKRTLKTRQISIENIKEQMGLVAVSPIKPEPVPVDVKIILIGSPAIYHALYEYDRDFAKLFKIKADFDEEMEWNDENIHKLAGFISAFCKKEGICHFDPTGVAEVIQYCSWLVQDQEKLTTRFNEIVNVLAEAAAWCEIDGGVVATGEHVKKAILEKHRRSSKYDEDLLKLLKDGTIMIDTEGMVVGQINGLSVLDVGDYVFGKPSRITAATYMGKSGIVNIEREADMSGVSHTKGVMILSGYIGHKYAQDIPLSLTASLCFEQLYGGVDGDSASSTELYAILSSLSGLPIRQGIAVTGSVNQKGEIQPIGGATQKIEGFFELCRYRGLTGDQGVIIPHQNVHNLVLNEAVTQAVEEGKFHIYAIRDVDEGIEILTGTAAGKIQEGGTYPEGTVNDLVYRKLKGFAETVARLNR